MSPVHVIMQGDRTLYWLLTLKLKRKECYILVLYRKVLPPVDYVKDYVKNYCIDVAIMLCNVILFGLA